MQQIYEQIRLAILQGDLLAGERLPSTRELAAELRVARSMLVEIYDQLLIEGYLTSQGGSGTYVAEGAYVGVMPLEPDEGMHPQPAEWVGLASGKVIDFRSGIPALDEFPRKIWGQLGLHVSIETEAGVFSYGQTGGRYELRRVLCQYLFRQRRVCCRPEQVIITTGAIQALAVAARVLARFSWTMFIEDPVNYEIQQILREAGLTLAPVAVDDAGINMDALFVGERGDCIFVTPSHQFPLGSILPIQRRLQLLQFVKRTRGYIVEDDYDSEFRYSGTAVSSMQGLDPERVIYIGTLSKILSPALRLGYIILPQSLLQDGLAVKHLMDVHTPSLEQVVLARFIEEGHLDRHVIRMKRIYRKRRIALINALKTHFAGHVQVHGDAAGLHLVAAFDGISFTEQIVDAMQQGGVQIYPVEQHAIQKGRHQNKLILGYANLTEEEIEEGVKRMKTELSNHDFRKR
ncbi:MAG TPA: PLP-dependent aminotransferase family protein [Ktedonosporobacter sp.]|nr:PLP-dependent aminotransferase family protein [Ktedonosporobacter sp.]